MRVENLSVKNFRNISEATLHPDRAINFLVGPNGIGKTSMIEALGLLATLRSFRDSKTASLIKWGTSRGEVACALTFDDSNSGEWKTNLRVSLQMTCQEAQKASK